MHTRPCQTASTRLVGHYYCRADWCVSASRQQQFTRLDGDRSTRNVHVGRVRQRIPWCRACASARTRVVWSFKAGPVAATKGHCVQRQGGPTAGCKHTTMQANTSSATQYTAMCPTNDCTLPTHSGYHGTLLTCARDGNDQPHHTLLTLLHYA